MLGVWVGGNVASCVGRKGGGEGKLSLSDNLKMNAITMLIKSVLFISSVLLSVVLLEGIICTYFASPNEPGIQVISVKCVKCFPCWCCRTFLIPQTVVSSAELVPIVVSVVAEVCILIKALAVLGSLCIVLSTYPELLGCAKLPLLVRGLSSSLMGEATRPFHVLFSMQFRIKISYL